MTISFYFLITVFTSISWHTSKASLAISHASHKLDSLYDQLSLMEQGLSKKAFAFAYKGYRRLMQQNLLSNHDYLVICDFSQSSKNKRMYILDIENKIIVINTYVAHGRKSGGEFANRFSNRPESHQSSLGFYITQNTYWGEHGLSLRMKGLEKGFNDKALKRNIVVHGADYIGDLWLQNKNIMGRSYGCPALPKKISNQVINMIKNGTCIFIYYPSALYLNGSKILND